MQACRELAVSCFSALLQAAPETNLVLLPYAMPVLEERLHMSEVKRWLSHVSCSLVILGLLGGQSIAVVLMAQPAVLSICSAGVSLQATLAHASHMSCRLLGQQAIMLRQLPA